MRIIIGFILGVMTASALSQDLAHSLYDDYNSIIMLNGVGPDGKMNKIMVDVNGYVICSKEKH